MIGRLSGDIGYSDSPNRRSYLSLLLTSTGKTRTLVGRAVDLLTEKKIHPEHILTLTFSNKAAEEMRTRIGVAAPEFARKLWMGTFHAFGLELLRKYGTRIGLAPKPWLLIRSMQLIC
jgi:DNA helicase-2/ATP-dependent DNA helicase PcrA